MRVCRTPKTQTGGNGLRLTSKEVSLISDVIMRAYKERGFSHLRERKHAITKNRSLLTNGSKSKFIWGACDSEIINADGLTVHVSRRGRNSFDAYICLVRGKSEVSEHIILKT
jgi:hypothetical protein